MNTRLDQLWAQALDRAVPETYTTLNPEQIGRVRSMFAELVVRDCVEIIEGYFDASPEIMGLPLDILEHFDMELADE